MTTLRLYLEFSRKAFRRAVAYRFNVWMRLFSDVFFLFMRAPGGASDRENIRTLYSRYP